MIFVEKEKRTGDFSTTKGLLDILEDMEKEMEIDDIAFIQEKIYQDEIGADQLADRIISITPLKQLFNYIERPSMEASI